jgi:hypothetical protein
MHTTSPPIETPPIETLDDAIRLANDAEDNGLHAEAAALWARARTFDPHNPSLLWNQVGALYRVPAYEAADEAAALAMAQNPDDPAFALEWCRVADAKCDWTTAAERYARAASLPSISQPMRLECLLGGMRAALEFADFERAWSLLQAAWPNIVVAEEGRGDQLLYVFESLAAHDLARQFLDKVAAGNPGRFNLTAEHVDGARESTGMARAHEAWRQTLRTPVEVLSVGQNCLPFALSLRWGLKDRPGHDTLTPFDLGSFPNQTAGLAIERDFADLLDPEALIFRDDGRGIPQLFQQRYSLAFYHERGHAWLRDGKDLVRAAYARRIAQYRDQAREGSRVFLYCICGAGDPRHLAAALRPVLSDGSAVLLVINVLRDDRFADWRDDQVVYRHIPYPSDYNWNWAADFNSPRGVAFESTVAEALRQAIASVA